MQLRSYIYGLLLFSSIIISKNDSLAQSERSYFHSIDSAYNHGNLDLAKSITDEAMQWANASDRKHSLSKFLIKYMSIIIEQDYTQHIELYYDSAYRILENINNPVEMANLWNVKARHLLYNQKYELARQQYKQIEKIYSAFPKDPLLGYYYNDIGYLEDNANNYDLAIDAYMQSIAIFENTNDSLGLANSYANLARTYFHIDDDAKAISYAEHALSIRTRHQEIEGVVWVLALLTEIYLKMEDKLNIMKYQQAYIQYAALSNKKHTIILSHANIAKWYAHIQHFDSALSHIDKAIAYAQQMQYPEIASYYIAASKYAQQLGLQDKAIAYQTNAHDILLKQPDANHWMEYHQLMMDNYKANGNFEKALQHLQLYNEHKEAAFNVQKHNQIAQLEIAYETQKKQAQLEAAIADSSQQQVKFNTAVGIFILSLTISIFLFSRYRLKRRIEQQQLLLGERNRISAELHDEVGSAISAIHLIAYKGLRHKSIPSDAQSVFQSIHQQAKQVMESINDIVWSIHPANERMEKIIERMKSFANEVLESVEVSIHYNISPSIHDIKLSPEKRKDLYLSFKEAINNTAKYAQATDVDISIHTEASHLILRVKDNGIGYNIEKVQRGNGIHNMKQRMSKHGGTTTVISSHNQGTEIEFILPYTS